MKKYIVETNNNIYLHETLISAINKALAFKSLGLPYKIHTVEMWGSHERIFNWNKSTFN